MKYFILLLPFTLFMLLFTSCSDLDQPSAHLTTEIHNSTPKAEKLYLKGVSQEQKGDWSGAAKTFDSLVKRYPTYEKAALSNYKAAQYWEKESEPEAAFDSYQHYIQTFRNGINYKSALDRQSSIAFTAAKGGLSTNFLGLKQEPQYSKVVEFLSKVRENAPASDLAARAQFAIGTYSESKEKTQKAVAAYFKVVDDYPHHKLAPEATFRAGKVLSGISLDGNHNTSNLKKARRTLEDLIQQYPNSSQAVEAEKLLAQISTNNLKRTYEIGEFYEQKNKLHSAKHYYQEVIHKSSAASHLHQKARKKIETLQNLTN